MYLFYNQFVWSEKCSKTITMSQKVMDSLFFRAFSDFTKAYASAKYGLKLRSTIGNDHLLAVNYD